MKVIYKNKRIWLPTTLQDKVRNSFIKVTIKSQNQKISFTSYFSDRERITIPKKYREKLNLKNGEEITVKVRRLRNDTKRYTRFLYKGKIDLACFAPLQTLSGFFILRQINRDSIFLWYSAPGRPSEVKIPRYAKKTFAKFLGYLQAEGGKPVLRKRKGRELSFTNKSLTLISEFLDLSQEIIPTEKWGAIISVNPTLKASEINEVIKKLTSKGRVRARITIRKAERIRKYSIRLWITNSLLAEFCYNAMNYVRKYLTGEKVDSTILRYFLQGLLLGDGNVYSWRDKRNCQHVRLEIFESNKSFIEDYKLLLEKIGIRGNVKKSKGKNLYILASFLRWENLVSMLKLGLFKEHEKHWNTLKISLKSHRKCKVLKYLIHFDHILSTSEFRKRIKRNYGYVISSLRSLECSGLIKKVGKKGNVNLWKLTEKGRNVKEVLTIL